MVAALAVVMPFEAAAQTYATPRTQFPLEITRADNALDQTISIVENRVYEVALLFLFGDQAERNRISALIGDGSRFPSGRMGSPGVAIPIRFRISSKTESATGHFYLEGTALTEGTSAFRSDVYVRTVVKVRLPPGIYRIQTWTVRDLPEFAGIGTHLEIGFDPRAKPYR
ncbi:DUF5625 family protein [Reyranella sp.]|uniref:DUF5625 family protein n=1 Tax=Reyranella sp. TaxID=1929291 RepID=UPI0025FE2E7A|nr:DUF5625 family protein [Reyranella sp.]